MKTRLALAALFSLIVRAHIGFWTSERWTTEVKLRVILLKTLGWAAVLFPAYGVSRWLAVREGTKSDEVRVS